MSIISDQTRVHFRYEEGCIIPLSEIRMATEKILRINTPERV
jgi:hypothetical protein